MIHWLEPHPEEALLFFSSAPEMVTNAYNSELAISSPSSCFPFLPVLWAVKVSHDSLVLCIELFAMLLILKGLYNRYSLFGWFGLTAVAVMSAISLVITPRISTGSTSSSGVQDQPGAISFTNREAYEVSFGSCCRYLYCSCRFPAFPLAFNFTCHDPLHLTLFFN